MPHNFLELATDNTEVCQFKILILMCKYCISSCVCGHTVCLRTLGNQAFEAVGSEQWNALPASPRFTVHKYIKPELVHKHYPNACLSRHVFRKDVYVLAFDLLSSLVLFILWIAFNLGLDFFLISLLFFNFSIV